MFPSSDLESYYDELIETEENDILDILCKKAPEDNLFSAISPDGKIVGISGSNEFFTSPEHTLFVFLSYMQENKTKTIEVALAELGIDLYAA
jgi:hypothetical protein